jgi:hypothetical protein
VDSTFFLHEGKAELRVGECWGWEEGKHCQGRAAACQSCGMMRVKWLCYVAFAGWSSGVLCFCSTLQRQQSTTFHALLPYPVARWGAPGSCCTEDTQLTFMPACLPTLVQVYDFPSTADPWAILEATNKDELAGFEYTIQVGIQGWYSRLFVTPSLLMSPNQRLIPQVNILLGSLA